MGKQESKYFLETEELMSREFYEFYKKERKKVALAIDQYNYFVKAVNGLLLMIIRTAVYTKGGVHIKGLGYFCHVRTKRKRRDPIEKNPLIKFKKKYRYKLHFIPDEDLKEWYLDFNHNFYKQLDNYIVDLNTINLFYEIDRYNRRLEQESKEMKYFIDK